MGAIHIDRRDAVVENYKSKGVPVMIYYAMCMHKQTAFKNLECQPGSFPVAEALSKTVFSLPMHTYLEVESPNSQLQLILEALRL